jgi:Transglutaminase-like superfamily
MSCLALRAYITLIHFDVYLHRRNFQDLYQKVAKFPIRKTPVNAEAVERICAAVDMACIWYWKEVLCLQRSATTACLLRQHGVAAQMIIGVQQMPFKAHAWVEVDGHVVNDRVYMREMYAVLDHC